jgi:uncharacterized protein (TIGR03435 family)
VSWAGLTSLVATFVFVQALRAQDQSPALPAFEVASVKPDTFVSSPGHGRVLELNCSNGRFVSRNASVWYLIKWGWNIVGDNDRLVGSPDWTKLGNEYYVVEAKAAAPVSEERCRLMVRTLLADRFHLRVHEEKRLIDAFDLVIAKNGPKVKRVTDPDAPVNGPGFTVGGETFQMFDAKAKGWTMGQLAYSLGAVFTGLGRKVFDRTGLEGIYRIDLSFRRPDDSGEGADVRTALREQLGLELRTAKEPLDVVVVDHVERPSQN